MTSSIQGGLVGSLSEPRGIQALTERELRALADEVRQRIIDTVTATGGHLGASLGTVELTIALHRVFTSPHDVVVFDTGHQTYPHKLLTGRADAFATLRQANGVSGYPSRAESEHDWVENSHASVSLAWVDGIAKALALQGERERRVVAVIGDGALTGGVAWEGLNNLGASSLPAIVVLNDNGRSYDPTVGAIARHLQDLRDGNAVHNLFEVLGFDYLGPIDGHDIAKLCAALRQAAELSKPVVVHAVTVKGRGYPPAEADESDRMHACGVIDVATGRPATPSPPSWTDVFEKEIVRIGAQRTDVVCLTAAMRLPTGLGLFSTQYPDRVFDSGIAEQHLLAAAAGLATAGAHPVVAVYATFLSRAFDQLLLDVGLHALPVTIVLDRAGVTGPDGPSHHGVWDLALLSSVPGLRIGCPRDPTRLRQMLNTAVATNGPTALRYPKGAPGADIAAIGRVDDIDVLHASGPGGDVLLIAVGAMAPRCLAAAQHLNAEGIRVTVVDPQWVWPPSPALSKLADRHRITVCVEDAIAEAGIGPRLHHRITRHYPGARVYAVGLPTSYLAHANRSDILARNGLDGPAIATVCESILLRLTATTIATEGQNLRSTQPIDDPCVQDAVEGGNFCEF